MIKDWQKDMLEAQGITYIGNPDENLKNNAKAAGMSVEEFVDQWDSMAEKIPDGLERRKFLMGKFLKSQIDEPN